MMSVRVCQYGRIGYQEAYRMQQAIQRQILSGETTDTLLLMEHLPVITIGKSGSPENVLVSESELFEKGISLYFTDRGGDVTYHGPGQLVAYPLFDLRNRGKDAHAFVHDLEETVIRTLREFSIVGTRDESHAGIWVEKGEIAAVGISLNRWVTMHGIALNVHTDPEHFALINPCGFSDRKAVSMKELLSRDIAISEVSEIFLRKFQEVFETDSYRELTTERIGGFDE